MGRAPSRTWVLRALGLLLLPGTAAGCALVEPVRSPAERRAQAALAAPATPSPTVPPPPPSPAPPPPPPVPTWEGTLAAAGPGVARLAVSTCGGGRAGSGFLVAPGVVLTAAEVVAGAAAVSVRLGHTVHSGVVAGVDGHTGLAAVRVLGEPPAGPVLPVAAAPAPPGAEVATLGYTFAGVLGPGRGVLPDTGATGGPVVGIDGHVVGVVGVAGAGGDPWAQRDAVAQAVAAWRDVPPPPPPVACGARRAGDAARPAVRVSTQTPDAASAAQALHLLAGAVSSGSPGVAWNLLTPRMQAQHVDLETFAGDLASTSHLELDVLDVAGTGPGAVEVLALSRTTQDAALGPDGQTCSVWTVRYGLVLEGGFWRVDSSRNQIGSPEPCEVLDGPAPDAGLDAEVDAGLDAEADVAVDIAVDVAPDPAPPPA
ncbi:hypothetical protein NUM3379_08240 [Kineococcus sp. NUM-3379]